MPLPRNKNKTTKTIRKRSNKQKLPLFDFGNFFNFKGIFSWHFWTSALKPLLAILLICNFLIVFVDFYSIINNFQTNNANAATATFTEDFTATTYKDAANTTANWDTTGGGSVYLPKDWVSWKNSKDGGNITTGSSYANKVYGFSDTLSELTAAEATTVLSGYCSTKPQFSTYLACTRASATWTTSANYHVVFTEKVDASNYEIIYGKWDGSNWTFTDLSTGISASGTKDNYPVMRLDKAGNPQVAWEDTDNSLIYYRRWSGSAWVDAAGTGSADSWAGNNPLLELDDVSSGSINSANPHLQYNSTSAVKYRYWNGSAWKNADGTGTEDDVTSGIVGFFNFFTEPNILKLDGSNHPHLLYTAGNGSSTNKVYYQTVGGDNKWGKADGTDTSGGLGDELTVNYSTSSDMDLNSTSQPQIIFNDGLAAPDNSTFTLKFTRWDGAAWVSADGLSPFDSIITDPGTGGNKSLYYEKLIVDSADKAHISVSYPRSSPTIIYTHWTGSIWAKADGTAGYDTISSDAGFTYPRLILGVSDVPILFWNTGVVGIGDTILRGVKWTGTLWRNFDADAAVDILNPTGTYVTQNSTPIILDLAGGDLKIAIGFMAASTGGGGGLSNFNYYIVKADSSITYYDSKTVQSATVATPSSTITSATLTATATTPGATSIVYSLSGDDGATWCPVITSGVALNLSGCSGSNLKWKAVLTNTGDTGETPTITNISISYTANALTLTAPNGGETLSYSEPTTITWTTAGGMTVNNVKLEYYDGSAWQLITASTSNTGSYSWTAPGIATAAARVRVTDVDDSNDTDQSDAVFTLGSLAVAVPNGGESYVPTATEVITWNTSAFATSMKIEYSLNNGSTWTTLSASAPNTGRYYWTIPATTTTQGLVRVSDAAVPANIDTSDANFSIVTATLKTYNFTTASDYTYDSSKISLNTTGRGYAQLKPLSAAAPTTNTSLNFTTEAAYTQENASNTDLSAGQFQLTNTSTVSNAAFTAGDIFVGNIGANTLGRLAPSSYSMSSIALSAGSGPIAVIVDAEGDLWSANYDNNTVSCFSYSSDYTSACSGSFPATVGAGPVALVLQPTTNQVWVANFGSDDGTTVSCLNQDGSACATPTVTVGDTPFGITVDLNGKIWVANPNTGGGFSGNTLTCLNSNGTYCTGAAFGPNGALTVGDGPAAIAVDDNNNLWVTHLITGDVTCRDASNNYALCGVAAISGLDGPFGIAIDTSDQIWVADSGVLGGWNGTTVSCFKAATGAACSTPSYTVGTGPTGVDIDKDGNVWVANSNSNNLTKLASPSYAATNYAVGDLSGSQQAFMTSDFTGNALNRLAPPTYPNGPYYISTAELSSLNTGGWYDVNSVTVTSTAPVGTTIKYLVSFDGRVTWKYWNGSAWAAASGADLTSQLATNGMSEATLEGLATANWSATDGFSRGNTVNLDFAYSLATTDTTQTPSVDLITVNYSPANFDTTNPTVAPTAAATVTYSGLTSFSETKGASHATDAAIEYQISRNNTAWNYWNGSTWAEQTGAGYPTQTNTAAEVNQNLTAFSGNGTFFFRAFLVSGSLSQLENINLGYSRFIGNPPPAGAPTAPTIGVPEALSPTAIRWNFTDNANNETGFVIRDSSYSIVASSPLWATTNLSYLDETGLSPNKQYIGRQAQSFNSQGYSLLSLEAKATYTLANTPSSPALSIQSTTSIKISLNINSNPSNTKFAIHEKNTDKFVQADGTLGSAAVWKTYTLWNSPIVTGLAPNTEYKFEVKSRNGDNIETPYSAIKSIITTTSPQLTKTVGINIQDGTPIISSVFQSLSFTSNSTNYFLAFFLSLCLVFLSLLIKSANNNGHKIIEKIKQLPSILVKDPAYSFETITEPNDTGVYRSSYLNHKRYHSLASSSILGLLTLTAIKIALVATLIWSGSAWAASSYLDDGKPIHRGDVLTYNIDFYAGDTGAPSLLLSDITDANLELVIGSEKVVLTNGTATTDGVKYFPDGRKGILYTVTPKANGYLTFKATVKSTVAPNTIINNTATIVATGYPTISSNTTTNKVIVPVTIPAVTLTLNAPAATNDTTPTISGATSPASQSVEVYLDGVKKAVVNSNSQGNYTYTFGYLNFGTYKVETKIGLVSSGEKTMTISESGIAVAAPVITNLQVTILPSQTSSGEPNSNIAANTSGQLINAYLIIKGTSSSNAKTITFHINSTPYTESFNPTSTSWTYTTAVAGFNPGNHSVYATAADNSGNNSAASNTKTFAISPLIVPLIPVQAPVSCDDACALDTDCQSDLVCSDGVCRNSSCNTEITCVCPIPVPTGALSCNNTCTLDSDCQSDLVCSDGVCRNSSCVAEVSCVCPVVPIATTTPVVPFTGTALDERITDLLPDYITNNKITGAISENQIIKFLSQKLFNNPTVEKVAQNYVAPGITILALAVVGPAITLLNLLSYLQLIFTQPILLFGRRKRKGWGTVYNSLTKMPVDLAIVRLYDDATKKLVQTRVTDKDGRYSFVVPEGKYFITATKPGFSFPTSFLQGQKEDAQYLDLYQGGNIEATNKQSFVALNIPVDPAEKMRPDKKTVFEYFLRKTQSCVALLGIILALVVFIIIPTIFMFLILVVHILLYGLFRRLAHSKRPKSWGIVYNEKNKKPLPFSVVRIFDTRFNKLLETQVTNRGGQYSFLVGKNAYYVTAEKTGFEKTQTNPIDLATGEKEAIVGLDVELKPAMAPSQLDKQI